MILGLSPLMTSSSMWLLTRLASIWEAYLHGEADL